ncbi:hypothetical protein K458DRAFT_320508 [Lentithecium fluviatile CBS 122367]|uniref:Heterokaryon incompatibility domain-containing protein n=1 Tax=Lentithecium fluviatile CBS 122367 TaxID=1168545 RepID=A0A6G1IFU0_9PLEO|nr:hypothetical protein K458DRAFT_320508 [Lentithecium fluviatile CBS 122367]
MKPRRPLYFPLDPTRKEVRFLEVVSTRPKTICKLQTVSLIDNPTYSAVSYVWGNASKTEPIMVNGTWVPVTVSLARAIKSIHRRSDMHQRLCANALCINQSDSREKNCQIPLMRIIYMNAVFVPVCLDCLRNTLPAPFLH